MSSELDQNVASLIIPLTMASLISIWSSVSIRLAVTWPKQPRIYRDCVYSSNIPFSFQNLLLCSLISNTAENYFFAATGKIRHERR